MFNSISEQDYRAAGLYSGEFRGSPVYINKVAYDEGESLVLCDIVGPDQVLQAFTASVSLNTGDALAIKGDDKVIRVKLFKNLSGNQSENKATPEFRHQIMRLGYGLGAMSRLIMYRQDVEAAVNTEKTITFSIIADTKEDADKQLINHIKTFLPVALPDQYMAKAIQVLQECDCMHVLKGLNATGYNITLNRDDLCNRLLPMILQREVRIKHESMLEFIDRCGKSLVNVIRTKMKPVFDMKKDEPRPVWKERVDALKRTPFDSQKAVIFSLVAAYEKGLGGAFAVGEMSTGKTTIGTSTAMVAQPDGMHLIMCPPQLTRKWRREIHSIAGNHVDVRILEDWRTIGHLFQIHRDMQANQLPMPLFLVLSRTRSRMYELWRHAVISRPAPIDEIQSGRFSKSDRLAACPSCMAHVVDVEKDESGAEIVKYFHYQGYMHHGKRRKCSECDQPLWQMRHEKPEFSDLNEQRKLMLKRWVSEIPGISAKKAWEEIERDGVDAIARELSSKRFDAFASRFFRANQRRRLENLRRFLAETPFTLTPCEYMPYKLIHRLFKGKISVFLPDECHELKGEETAQGLAYGTLAAASRFTVPLTGTLIGGYANDVHPLLQRLAPGHMEKVGYGYGKHKEYQAKEGVLEETKILKDENARDLRTSRGAKSSSVRLRRKPGYSAVAVARDLLPLAAFIRLEDLQKEVEVIARKTGGKLRLLPSYREVFVSVPMTDTQREAYGRFERAFKEQVRGMPPSPRSKALHMFLYAPDMPDQAHVIHERVSDEKTIHLDYEQVCSEYEMMPKEQEILKMVEKEIEEGRRVMLFASYTSKHDITPRLLRILQSQGINAVRLRGHISTSEREEWLKKQVEKGVQVVISNPACVMTGLDLIDFPTLAFVQPSPSTYVLRQASRRGWRIGQTKPCRVYFFCYQETAQEISYALMANKQRVSLNAEGDLSESALDSMADADDGLAAISRAIAGHKNITLSSSIQSINDDSNEGEYLATISRVPTQEDIDRIIAGENINNRASTVEDELNFGLFARLNEEKSNEKPSVDVRKTKAEPKKVEIAVDVENDTDSFMALFEL